MFDSRLCQPPRCPLCKAIPLTAEQLKKAGFTTSVDLTPGPATASVSPEPNPDPRSSAL